MAKLYYAKHHIRLKHKTVRPGEVIEETLDEKTIQRLLRLEAIGVTDIPDDIPGMTDGEEDATALSPDISDNSENATNDVQEIPDDVEDVPDDVEDVPDAEPETLMPEIDVMDGISAAPKAEKPASKRKSTKIGGKAK